MLLQISEPGQSPKPHERKRAVGIDLGTTNSLVATVRSGEAKILAESGQPGMVPSVVHYVDSGSPIVGTEALKQASSDPQNTFISIKRGLGKSLTDLREHPFFTSLVAVEQDNQVPAFETRAGNKTAIEISAEILKVMKSRGEAALEGELDGAVITVPAYFDEAQRQATKDAAKLAGLNVLRLLSEPTAASVAYGLDRQADDEVVAVYDLGGGTFDISILHLTRGVFQVLATGGDSALGGDDFDYAIVAWIEAQLDGEKQGLSMAERRSLWLKARDAKEALSSNDTAVIHYDAREWVLTREIFAGLIQPIVEKTLLSCRKVLRDAELSKDEVDHVVMVGGSTRTHYVQLCVEKFFGKAPKTDIDPDRVVALGAAIQADMLVGNPSENEVLLLDVTPLSLGLETMGGLVEKIIDRNTTIPVAKAQEFTTYKDGQTAIAIHILQGERDLVKDCRSLARFDLKGIPPMVAGAAKVRVTFQIDADGLLSVAAEELSAGVKSSIQVKPSHGLSEDTILKMIEESFGCAEEDKQARALKEQQVEADRVLEALNVALEKDGRRLLDAQELLAIRHAMNELDQLKSQNDSDAILHQIEVVNGLSEAFAARRMNETISQALTGRVVEDI